MQRHFQTIIIGAGPGGLACATLLAKHGREVLLLERNETIGAKVCAGGITWSGLGSRLPGELIQKRFSRQHIRTARQQIVISDRNPIISTVDRRELGSWMVRQAEEAGVVLLRGCRVREIGRREISSDAGPFSFDYLVGADGANSLVRRSLNLPCRSYGAGIHYQVPGNFGEMVWQLDPRLFRSGYAWIFPHRTHASIGAYADCDHLPASLLQQNLHAWMEKHGIRREGLQAQAAVIPYDYRGYRFGNVFLVGDAAGLSSALTGEGIYPAVSSGRMVAENIVNPSADSSDFRRMISKHRRHAALLRLCGHGRLTSELLFELLLLALRLRLLHFSALEMG